MAAISVGMVGNRPVLDLNYVEDSTAEVDMNVVMTGAGAFVEVQGTAEQTPFAAARLDELLALAERRHRPAGRACSGAPSRRVATSAFTPLTGALVLATANRAKGREMAALLAGLPYRIADSRRLPGRHPASRRARRPTPRTRWARRARSLRPPAPGAGRRLGHRGGRASTGGRACSPPATAARG